MSDENWYPSKEEYDPGITKEQWIELIQDKSVFTEESLITFACMRKAKLSTSIAMSEEFGRTYRFYYNTNWRTGKRVYERTNCPLYEDKYNKYWLICCVARQTKENHHWEFKMRPELQKAFDETGILNNVELYQLEKEPTMTKAEELAKLLSNTHNIILHGAPGTGKTYLAREIAKQMGCPENEIGFVQFHPSYDYTDFVEGIRPRNSEDGSADGFERRNGVFKEFCRKAIIFDIWDKLNDNPTIWKVSLGNPSKQEDKDIKPDCFQNGYIRLNYSDEGDDAKTCAKAFKDTMKIGDIVLVRSGDSAIDAVGIITSNYYEYPNKQGRYQRYRKMDWIIKEKEIDISDENGGKFNWSSVHTLPNITPQKVKAIVEKHFEGKPFVFIIDEINRGEMSKIFGELFFSIDPGYRGTDGKIRTQYANMQNEPNEFDTELGIQKEEGNLYGHFFVPENVYIIGTMNDIDRSVESMDFAMRRRFTFVEITAEETQESILQSLNGDIKEKAISRMNALNEAISKIDGLSSAYHIGAAYFLKLKNLDNDFDLLWKYHLEPLLREYLRGQGDVEEKIKQLEQAYQQ